MWDASSESGRSHGQKQTCPDDDGSDGSHDALTRRCETFNVDGCSYDSHRAKIHYPGDQEDHYKIDTTVDAAESVAQVV